MITYFLNMERLSKFVEKCLMSLNELTRRNFHRSIQLIKLVETQQSMIKNLNQ